MNEQEGFDTEPEGWEVTDLNFTASDVALAAIALGVWVAVLWGTNLIG